MGEKDTSEKMLADYNDVFADIVNVLLFDGKRIIDQDSLKNTKAKSQYKAARDNKIHEMERDNSKYWMDGNVRIALYGLENQTVVDKDMIFRVIGYDGISYREQLLKKVKTRYPIVTLVLNFSDKRWNGPKSLKEALHIPKVLDEYVNDYKMNIFDISYLTNDQVEMFQSDFRIVADYFVQKQNTRDYQPSRQKIEHVDEILKLMSVLTDDDRFYEVANSMEGGNNMCEVLDRIEKKGIEKGIEQGRQLERNSLLIDLVKDGIITITEAAKRAGISESSFKLLL